VKEIISYGRFQCDELAPHKNRGMEITYIEKGMLEWMAEGVIEKVESGSIYFTLPWQVHGSLSPTEPDNTVWHVLFHLAEDSDCERHGFGFPSALGFTRKEQRILSKVFAGSRRHCFRATNAIRAWMPALVGELQSTHELREAQALTLLRAILVELKRIIAGEVVDKEEHSVSERRVRELIGDLPSNCDQQWSLTRMATTCGIQRTQLSKIFQRLTGSSPMEYLFRIRIERAKRLLRETDTKVIDIAFSCGYSSSQYFANTFKQATGTTPTAYRNSSTTLTAAETRDWKSVRFRTEAEERMRVQRFSARKEASRRG
jgi:AraC-like DNA-binding protein